MGVLWTWKDFPVSKKRWNGLNILQNKRAITIIY